ncbi:MAG: methyl-accepting chemotaxis protein [Candidatus Hydrogenedentes bacterium]|nr:methyl-accepting chemotaxis protein [Candidatus Hydrogenedentota bacterium]
MSRSLTLSARILLGFSVLVVLAAALGFSGWYGVRGVDVQVKLSDLGYKAVTALDACGFHRRDFAKFGFDKKEGQEKNAAELFKDSRTELVNVLESLETNSALSKAAAEQVAGARVECDKYLAAFETVEKAQTARSSAFDEWKRIGVDVTASIGQAMTDVIEPGIAAAQTAGDVAALSKWSAIGLGLENDIVENFLLLRVQAVYLIATGKQEQIDNYEKQLTAMREAITKWQSLVAGEAALESAAGTIMGFIDEYANAGDAYKKGLTDQANAEVVMQECATSILNTISGPDGIQSKLNTAKEAIIARTEWMALILSIAGVVIGMFLAFFIARSISKPINHAITQLGEGSTQLTAASDQIATVSQELAESTSEQAASLEESSASLEELTSMTHHNADNANQANTMSNDSRKAVEEAQQAMKRMSDAMGKIRTSADETAKILKTIDEIAFQTNLLALNAAVEAARAGEAGKGFAVVAEEVRALAQRSAEASKSTAVLIEGSRTDAENGVHVVNEVAHMLERIDEGARNVAQLIAEVSAACREQTSGIDQLNTAVSQMDRAVQANAASSEESASASEELNAQAREVGGVVQQLAALVGANVSGMETAAPPKTRAGRKNPPLQKPAFHADRRTVKQLTHHAAADKPKEAPKKAAQPTKASPEEIIPLDEDDLKDF